MAVTITAVRPLLVGGVQIAVGGTAEVSDALATDLIWRGDATGTLPTPPSAPVDSLVRINASQIADSGVSGRALLQSANLAAVLTALGATYGAADSGGTGYKVLRFPN